MRNVIGAVLVLVALIALITPSYADEIQIPFAIYEDDFLKDAKEHGFDLYDSRTADGFIENRASYFIVYTYHTATTEQLELIKELTRKNIRI